MGTISKESIRKSDAQLATKRPRVESTLTDAAPASRPSFAPPSSSSEIEVSLTAIMDQLQFMCADLVVILTIFLMRCVR